MNPGFGKRKQCKFLYHFIFYEDTYCYPKFYFLVFRKKKYMYISTNTFIVVTAHRIKSMNSKNICIFSIMSIKWMSEYPEIILINQFMFYENNIWLHVFKNINNSKVSLFKMAVAKRVPNYHDHSFMYFYFMQLYTYGAHKCIFVRNDIYTWLFIFL